MSIRLSLQRVFVLRVVDDAFPSMRERVRRCPIGDGNVVLAHSMQLSVVACNLTDC